MGRIAEARALLEELLHRARQGYVPPFALAEAHAVLGDADEAMRLLGQAFEERSNGMVYLRSTRSLERLQVDPRFEALIGRVGSESERREVPR